MPYLRRDGSSDLITMKIKILEFGSMSFFKRDGPSDLIIIKIKILEFG